MSINKEAFTLVELIVVITILAILATIGFVSFSGYLAGTRDTNRVAQLKSMSDALELYRTKKDLPIPDDKVDIKTNTKTIAYQGYIGKNVLETIEYTESGLDPKYKQYFSYYLTKNKKYFQLMALLEEPNTDVLALNNINKTNAADYSDRYPLVKGKKLGILTGTGIDLNTPIQELITDSLNIETTTGSYIANISNNSKITGTGIVLNSLEGLGNLGGNLKKAEGKSCKNLQESYGRLIDGVYKIDPEQDGTGFDVYCDMTTDGGGWTLVHKTTDSQNDLSGDLTENEGIANWENNEEYRLSINFWKGLSSEKAMAKNIRVDGLKWNDIEIGYIDYIGIDRVDFSESDIYKLFNNGTFGGIQNSCTSGTNYWNTSCCSRCVNYDGIGTFGKPNNSPMLSTGYDSLSINGVEGAGGTSDSTRHRLLKMGIFLK